MPRRPRMYLPDVVYEVMSETMFSSFALRPCAESTELMLGVIGRAQHLYPAVRVHAINPLSTRDTQLISSPEPEQIPAFIGFVKSNVSKELKRLHRLPFGVFASERARVLPIHPGLKHEEWRLRGVLAEATKENLVASPRDWPGVTGVHAMEGTQHLSGWWHDRAAENRARASGQNPEPLAHATEYQVTLSPLPSWAAMTRAECKQRVSDIVDEIETTFERARREDGASVLGAEAIMAFSPTFVSKPVEKTPSPQVLALGHKAYRRFRSLFDAFCRRFWEESRRERRSPEHRASFPPFSFPPGRRMTKAGLAYLWSSILEPTAPCLLTPG